MSNLLVSVASLALLGGVARADTVKTIVLVHGAFADGSSWDKVAPLLQAKGFNVVSVHQPLDSLDGDVGATRRVIEAQPGPVLLVGHSWGGAVITVAGNDAKVAGLVYVAAFAPGDGESVNDLGKGHPAPPWVTQIAVDSAGFGSLPPAIVAKDFAQDLSATDAKALAVKQGPIALKSFDAKIKTAAWKSKPSWYIRAEQDHMIDPAAQAAMAQRIGAKVTNVRSSHVPMLSKPAEVAAAILVAAAGEK